MSLLNHYSWTIGKSWIFEKSDYLKEDAKKFGDERRSPIVAKLFKLKNKI